MTEDFHDKLHQEESKQAKVVKICVIIRREPECGKFSKIFYKAKFAKEYAKLNK